MKTVWIVLLSALGGVVIFVIGITLLFSSGYFFSNRGGPSGVRLSESGQMVSVAPPIHERYLGPHGQMSGAYSGSQTTLAAGPARIEGQVTIDGRPLAGLSIRLQLNDAVFSQWATSDGSGKYSVGVPPGDYRVDGYELDSDVADKLLAGKTLSRGRSNDFRSRPGAVTTDQPGHGVDLAFVDPVRKLSTSQRVSALGPVTLRWERYPGAASYRVLLIEHPSRDPTGGGPVISIPKLGVAGDGLTDTVLQLPGRGVVLKPGYSYEATIEALDDRGQVMSDTGTGYDSVNSPDIIVAE